MHVQYLVVHTAAFDGPATVDMIRQWHRARGFNGFGYHAYIRRDGTVEFPPDRWKDADPIPGAHVARLNSRALGICCEGHGDVYDFTPEQHAALTELLVRWCQRFRLPYHRIKGHRETYDLLNARRLKTCPGKKVDMRAIRIAVRDCLQLQG